MGYNLTNSFNERQASKRNRERYKEEPEISSVGFDFFYSERLFNVILNWVGKLLLDGDASKFGQTPLWSQVVLSGTYVVNALGS